PGHTPLELPYLAPAYAQRHREPMAQWTSVKQPGADFAAALARHGVGLAKGRYGATWTTDATRRAQDLAMVRGWLEDAQPPAMLHRAAPRGPVPISGMPVTLTPAERAAYEAEWGEVCREMDIARRGRDPAKGRAALPRRPPPAAHTPAGRGADAGDWRELWRGRDMARRGRDTATGRARLLRFRQKAGLIRVGSTAQWIAQQVEAERQVACSVEFVGTAAAPITVRLQDAGLEVAPIYGRDRFDVEAQRLRAQTGEAKVCWVITVAAVRRPAGESVG